MFGGQPAPPDSDHAGTTLFYLISAFVALALPTTLMGATLPMLARYAVAEEAQIGRRIGLLYAMNTAGAVVGALLTAFVLLPELGLKRTIWVGAALNAVVFLLAVALAQRVSVRQPAPRVTHSDAPRPAPRLAAVRDRHSLARRFPGPGVGAAADVAGGRRRVLPGSAVGAHAVACRGQQHLRLRRHGRELPHRHRARRRAGRRASRAIASARRWRWRSR